MRVPTCIPQYTSKKAKNAQIRKNRFLLWHMLTTKLRMQKPEKIVSFCGACSQKNFKNIKGQSIKKDMSKLYKRKYQEDDKFEGWANNVTREYDSRKKGVFLNRCGANALRSGHSLAL